MAQQQQACAGRRHKLAMVGAGLIGSTAAYNAGQKGLGDVVLFDIVPNMPAGKARDLSQFLSLSGTNVKFAGSNNYEILQGADVAIVTAGLTKISDKPDAEWSRDDLLPVNSKIIRQVGEAIKKNCPGAFVICITNPLDCMVKILQEASGVPNNMICGMAGVLDSARLSSFIAEKLDVAPSDVSSLVIGSHGDAMVPLLRYCTVKGIPLNEFVNSKWMTKEDKDKLINHCKFGGKEIVNLLGHGSAYHSPASAAIAMAEAYLLDKKNVMCCSVKLSGEYGIDGLFVGVPVVIGAGGIERIIQLELTAEEKQQFDESVQDVRVLLQKLENMEIKQ